LTMKTRITLLVYCLALNTAIGQTDHHFIPIPGSEVRQINVDEQNNLSVINTRNMLVGKGNGDQVTMSTAFGSAQVKAVFRHSDSITLLETKSEVLIFNPKNGIQSPLLQGKHKVLDYDPETYTVITYDGNLVGAYQHGKRSEVLHRSDSAKAMIILEDFLIEGSGSSLYVYELRKGLKATLRVNDSLYRVTSIHAHENTLFVGTQDGKMNLVSMETDPLTLVTTHTFKTDGFASSVSVSPDGRYIATGSKKGTLSIYDISREELLYQKKDLRGGPLKQLAFNPNGENLYAYNLYRNKIKAFDVKNLDITPAFYFTDESDNNPPQILITTPRIRNDLALVSTDAVEIEGLAVDDYGINTVTVNGFKTPLNESGKFTVSMALSPGQNRVRIEAADVNGNIAVKYFDVKRQDLDQEVYDPSKAENYLFVIGINNYKYWPMLSNAVSDANNMVNILTNIYNFEPENVTFLKDEEATRQNIYNRLREYVEIVGPNDNFMLFFAGHGYFDDLLNEGYWVPVDGELNSMGDYLSNSDILKVVKEIKSQHTFLVADACFSGSLFMDGNRGYIENVEKFRSRWALASGRLEAVSDGSTNNSPFTRTLLNYLGRNMKEKIAVSEVVQYVKFNVPEIADQTPVGNPLRNIGDEGGEFILYRRTLEF
jgi:WD40 repeat protein